MNHLKQMNNVQIWKLINYIFELKKLYKKCLLSYKYKYNYHLKFLKGAYYMELYKRFKNKKDAGKKMKLDDLSPEELKILFIEESKTDRMIADLFEVVPSKITYLRRKHGITLRNSAIEDFFNPQSDISKNFNSEMKKVTLTSENITKISKALTHFAFRNGPIEDMHADSTKHITDRDMMTLNKYMVNRLAYVFKLLNEDKWAEFNFLVEQMDFMFGGGLGRSYSR